jgi:hypothetical protein
MASRAVSSSKKTRKGSFTRSGRLYNSQSDDRGSQYSRYKRSSKSSNNNSATVTSSDIKELIPTFRASLRKHLSFKQLVRSVFAPFLEESEHLEWENVNVETLTQWSINKLREFATTDVVDDIETFAKLFTKNSSQAISDLRSLLTEILLVRVFGLDITQPPNLCFRWSRAVLRHKLKYALYIEDWLLDKFSEFTGNDKTIVAGIINHFPGSEDHQFLHDHLSYEIAHLDAPTDTPSDSNNRNSRSKHASYASVASSGVNNNITGNSRDSSANSNIHSTTGTMNTINNQSQNKDRDNSDTIHESGQNSDNNNNNSQFQHNNSNNSSINNNDNTKNANYNNNNNNSVKVDFIKMVLIMVIIIVIYIHHHQQHK